ncbi:hypothetical protein [Dyadobacter sp. BHUBP1]|uniref:nSTAND3 domain-containing NTPase n=1 Tax=Dyadobacter sp. BHUBP1 TaxID=3424178 RepID=UPI003D34B800
MNRPRLLRILGIPIASGQLVSAAEFVEYYQRSSFSTPLDNSFLGRTEEIDLGVSLFTKSDLLLISGNPGVGKTKLALELCQRLVKSYENCELLCVSDVNAPIWEDLHQLLSTDINYVIFVDDANLIETNFSYIRNFAQRRSRGQIKIVATVRKAALDSLQSKLGSDFEIFEINPLSPEGITAILKSPDFNLNSHAIERILKLSNGNPRLAIMAARVGLKTNKLSSLDNAESIYDNYFGSVFHNTDLLKDKETLKIIAVIHFFGYIKMEYYNDMATSFPEMFLDIERFEEKIKLLYRLEILDIYDDSIVKVSEQILGTYLFYKSVFDIKAIDLSQFIDLYSNYSQRIKNVLLPVMDIYSYSNILNRCSDTVQKKWRKLSNRDFKDQLQYLDTFWYLIPDDTLSFLYKHVSSITKNDKSIHRKNHQSRVENNVSSEFENDKIVNILSRYANLDDRRLLDSLEILISYVVKVPQKHDVVKYCFENVFKINWDSVRYGYRTPALALNFLTQEGTGESYSLRHQLAIQLIPAYLAIRVEDTSFDGKQVNRVIFTLLLDDKVTEIRKLCWTFLNSNIARMKHEILSSFLKLDFRLHKKANKIHLFDNPYIINLAENLFDLNSLEDCIIYNNLLTQHSRLRQLLPRHRISNNAFTVFLLLGGIHPYRSRPKWEKSDHQTFLRKVRKFTKNYTRADYSDVFRNILLYEEICSRYNIHWYYRRYLSLFLSAAGIDEQLFTNVLIDLATNFPSIQVDYSTVFYFHLQRKPVFSMDLFGLTKLLQTSDRINFLIVSPFDGLEKETILKIYKELLLIIDESTSGIEIRQWDWLDKFFPVRPKINVYTDITQLAVNRDTIIKPRISLGKYFIMECMDLHDISIEDIEALYINEQKIDNDFDFNLQLFEKIFLRDTSFFLQLMLLRDENQRLIKTWDYRRNYDGLWKIPLFDREMEKMMRILVDEDDYNSLDEEIYCLFPQGNSQSSIDQNLLTRLAGDKEADLKLVAMVFHICLARYPKLKLELVKQFLSWNFNIDDFKYLPLVRRGYQWNGNDLVNIDEDTKSWQDLLDVVEQLPSRLQYLDHCNYINLMLKSLGERRKETLSTIYLEST